MESQQISLLPQFVPGRTNVVAGAHSCPHQVIGAEWTLHQEVFDMLRKWPLTINLFASSLNHRCGIYFAPVSDPMAVGTDAMLQSWDFLMAYEFPPFALISLVLVKLRASQGAVLTLIALFWPQKGWFPDLLNILVEHPLELPLWWDLLRQPHIQKFHQSLPLLRLHAWRFLSTPQEPPASLWVWLNGS